MSIILEMWLVAFSLFLSLLVFCWMIDGIRRSKQ